MVNFIKYTPVTVPDSDIVVEAPPTLDFPDATTYTTPITTDTTSETSTTPTISWYNSDPEDPDTTKATTTVPSGTKDKVIQFAASKIGPNNYKWGATGENGKYDCSGLIYAAYASQGISVPRTTQAWLSSNRSKIDSQSGKPGDVIITKSKSGHHARLITNNLGKGNYECIEAAGKQSGIKPSTYTVDSNLSGIYRAKRGLKLIKKRKYEQFK